MLESHLPDTKSKWKINCQSNNTINSIDFDIREKKKLNVSKSNTVVPAIK